MLPWKRRKPKKQKNPQIIVYSVWTRHIVWLFFFGTNVHTNFFNGTVSLLIAVLSTIAGKFLEGNLADLSIHTFWPVNSISINLPKKIFRKAHKDLCLLLLIRVKAGGNLNVNSSRIFKLLHPVLILYSLIFYFKMISFQNFLQLIS